MQTQFNSISRPVSNQVASTNSEEAASCFEVFANGMVMPAIELAFRHPLGNGYPALIVGMVPIIRPDMNGCKYAIARNESGTYGVVRNAVVRQREGRKVLEKPRVDSTSILALVHHHADLVSGAKMHENFFTEVLHNGRTMGFDREGGEVLIQWEESSPLPEFTVLYTDGSVVSFYYDLDKATFIKAHLNIEEQADKRVKHALNALQHLEGDFDSQKRRQDACQHQLASVLAVGGKRSTVVFQKVYDLLVSMAEHRELGKGVRMHVLKALEHTESEYEYFRDRFCTDLTGTRMTFGAPTRGNIVPREILNKKRERAERDRNERLAMKGISRSKDEGRSKKNSKK